MHAKRRRAFTISAAAAALLVVPAAAEAATYVVQAQGGTCGAPDLVCGSLPEAAKAVAANDTVQVGNDINEGATFDDAGITIQGPAVPEGSLPTAQITSTLVFTGGGTATVANIALGSKAGPGIDARGTTSLSLDRSLLLVGNGNGISVDEGASVTVRRSRVIASAPAASAILYLPSSGTAKTVTLDSSILSGGGAGSGVRVENSGAAPGAVDIQARHVTVAGSTNAFFLAANGALLGGSITGAVTDSIISGAITQNRSLLNTVSLDTGLRNDLTTQPALLFVNPAGRDFALLATSPAIGKGANGAANDLDVDGQIREAGQPSDLGADEFVNTPPVARAAATRAEGRQNRPVTFSAAGSADRDGPLLGYEWTFSDGQKVITRVPTVEHRFSKEGRAGVVLRVADTSGVFSAPAVAAVTILDGIAPLVGIDTPKANATIRRLKGKKKQAIRISGRSADKSGMKQVLISIRQVSRSTAKARGSQTSSRRCRWLKRVGITARSCDKPVLLGTRLAGDGRWTYTIPASRVPVAGTYEVSAIGVDRSGAFGNSGPAKSAKVRFRLR